MDGAYTVEGQERFHDGQVGGVGGTRGEVFKEYTEGGKRSNEFETRRCTWSRRVAVAPSVPPAWTSRAESDFDRPRVDAFERIEDADDGQSSFTFIGLV